MRRREFIRLGSSAAIAWPLTTRAQQPGRMRRIGILMGFPEADREGQAFVAAFRDALRQLGWIDGRNIRIDRRWAAADDSALIPRFASELVALEPDLILSHSTPTTAALLKQTRSIPIIFAFVSDPLGSGFVASFREPSGNATGFIVMEPTMASKWLELLREIAPRITRVAFLFNPTMAPYASYYLEPFKTAATSAGVEPIASPVHDISELETTIGTLAREPSGGFMVMPDAFTDSHREKIVSLAARFRVPAVYPFRSFTAAGGLLSYGTEQIDNFRRAASYADRILKGAKASELPVQGPVKFVLAINLKAAKVLDIDVPMHLEQRADEVIE